MKNSMLKKIGKIVLLLVAGFIINDLIELGMRYFKERIALRDYMEKELKKRATMDTKTDTERGVERKAEFVEAMFLKYGAEQVFTTGEEKFRLRRTYKYNAVYYRLSISEIDGETFLIVNAVDEDDYADIGIMEEIAAFPPSLSEKELEREVRCLLEFEDYPV
ncbi:MAG: hypothetical protein IKR23_01145 [Lachnospiraceae bacterium]|nr:hypothetical protein [Lachnospiraceae bacterium]MBR6255956.1 hypothetical protein [Lachnospiraceae bacterium]